MAVLQNYYQSVYSCPVVDLTGYTAKWGLSCHLYAYLNFGGPTGTAKDSLAEGMLSLALQKGALSPGQPVLEAGSGAFAAALCIAARRSGHPVILVVPPTLSGERQIHLQQLGAELVFSMEALETSHNDLAAFAASTAQQRGAYFIDCFSNDDNPEFHRRLTGPAILAATHGGDDIDAIVTGVGTGGTITGVGEHTKAWTNHIRMVAVEPYESQALSGGFIGRHGIPGIGVGFVPQNYNPYIVDIRMAVPTGEALAAAQEVLLTDAIPACASAGAALFAARQLMEQGRSKNALCIFSGRQLYG